MRADTCLPRVLMGDSGDGSSLPLPKSHPEVEAEDSKGTKVLQVKLQWTQYDTNRCSYGYSPRRSRSSRASALPRHPAREQVAQLLRRSEPARVQQVEPVEEVEGRLSHRAASAPRRGAGRRRR